MDTGKLSVDYPKHPTDSRFKKGREFFGGSADYAETINSIGKHLDIQSYGIERHLKV